MVLAVLWYSYMAALEYTSAAFPSLPNGLVQLALPHLVCRCTRIGYRTDCCPASFGVDLGYVA